MPIDKQSKGSAAKPITPALSSRFRNGKIPLAPRLAGSTPVSPAVSARREARDQTLSPLAEQNQGPSLNGNVTPRSGARTTRISTESPTSPATKRRLSGTSAIQETLSTTRSNLAITSPQKSSVGAPRLGTKANSPNTSASRRTSGSSNVSGQDEDATKFFRPNATNPSAKSAINSRPLSTAYLKVANPRAANSAPPSTLHTNPSEKQESFVKADEVRVRAARPQLRKKQSTTSLTSTASMNTARTRSPNLSRTQSQPVIQTITQLSPKRPTVVARSRPQSPQKQPAASSSSLTLKQDNSFERRRSLSSSAPSSRPTPPLGHKKSSSISSLGIGPKLMASPLLVTSRQPESTWPLPVITLPVHPPNPIIPTPETLSPRSASLTSFKTVATSVTSDTDISDVSKNALPTAHSALADAAPPNQTQKHNPVLQAQADASNARRERKVLDLEISNSSLLAINKTLEKELRKQSLELRRFRRLSRSGRISFAPTNRSVSGQSATSLGTLQEQTEDDGDHSEEEEDNESESEEISDESDEQVALDDSSASGTARARRRARDERRLMLDLSKHQQLLIDSQKLTQNIRKCLNLTEELIKDGKQALEYKVGIGDIKLGGRVLSVDDEDIEAGLDHSRNGFESRQGLLSPSVATAELQAVGPWGDGDQTVSEQLHHAAFESPDPG